MTDKINAMLKAYSLIPRRRCSQKFQYVIFLHLFVAFLREVHFPTGIYQESFPHEIRAIFSINSCVRDLIEHSSLWSSAKAQNHA